MQIVRIIKNSAVLILALLFSCAKEGAEGPPGPEGPPGNNGSNGGSGEGVVLAFQTPVGSMFRWRQQSGEEFDLHVQFPRATQWSENGVLFDDTSGHAYGSLIVSFMRASSSPGDTAWYALPFLAPTDITERMDVYRDRITVRQQDKKVLLQQEALIPQPPTNVKSPAYKVFGLRVLMVPSSESGILRKAASDGPGTMEALMEKYGIRENDFMEMRPSPPAAESPANTQTQSQADAAEKLHSS